jgi:hypothetical protein
MLLAWVKVIRRLLREMNPASALTRWQRLAFWSAVAVAVAGLNSHQVGLGAKVAADLVNRTLCIIEQQYGLPWHPECPKVAQAAGKPLGEKETPEPVDARTREPEPSREIASLEVPQGTETSATKRPPDTKSKKQRVAMSRGTARYRVSPPPLLRHRGVPVYQFATPFSRLLGWIRPGAANVVGVGRREYFLDPSSGPTTYVQVVFDGGRGWVCEAFLRRVNYRSTGMRGS